MMVYVLVDGAGRMVGVRAFTDKGTAEFAKNGMMMFAPEGDTTEVYVRACRVVDGNVDDFLATAGLGPKAVRA